MTPTTERYQPPNVSDALRLPAGGPSAADNAQARRDLPAGVDVFVSDGPGRLTCTSKTVGQKTADQRTGARNEYALTYAWTPPNGVHKGRFAVTSCGCLAWLRGGACRHAVGADDLLNAPPVAASLLCTRAGQAGPAEVIGAYANTGADGSPTPCAVCGTQTLHALIYTPPLGYCRYDCCPECKSWRTG